MIDALRACLAVALVLVTGAQARAEPATPGRLVGTVEAGPGWSKARVHQYDTQLHSGPAFHVAGTVGWRLPNVEVGIIAGVTAASLLQVAQYDEFHLDRFVLIDAGVFVAMQPFTDAPITLRARIEAAYAWASGLIDVVPTPPGSRHWFGFDGELLGFGVAFPLLGSSPSRFQFGVEAFASYLQARSTSFSPAGLLITIGMRSS